MAGAVVDVRLVLLVVADELAQLNDGVDGRLHDQLLVAVQHRSRNELREARLGEET